MTRDAEDAIVSCLSRVAFSFVILVPVKRQQTAQSWNVAFRPEPIQSAFLSGRHNADGALANARRRTVKMFPILLADGQSTHASLPSLPGTKALPAPLSPFKPSAHLSISRRLRVRRHWCGFRGPPSKPTAYETLSVVSAAQGSLPNGSASFSFSFLFPSLVPHYQFS